MAKYVVRHLDDVAAVPCPCGASQRILTREHNDKLSIHRVRIDKRAKKHYHKKLTEYYVILSGAGEMELDGDRVPVKPGDVIMIPPMTQHVARGEMEIINIVSPPFDPEDESVVEG